MKTTITIQPLTPFPETLTYEQAKARPGIYRTGEEESAYQKRHPGCSANSSN